MNYKEYQAVRDAAWRILLDCKIMQLPTDLNLICRMLGIQVRSYNAASQFIQRRGLEALTAATDGLTLFNHNEPVILFNQKNSPQRVRFTVGHELGHLLLKHIQPGGVTVMNREPSTQDNPLEREANMLSARLLAPACVLWGLDLHTPEEIAAACHISTQAAEFRAERMEILYRRDRFLTSQLEREVYEQFQPFIKESQNFRPEV